MTEEVELCYGKDRPPKPRDRKPIEKCRKVIVCGVKKLAAKEFPWFCKTLDDLVAKLTDPVILVCGSTHKEVSDTSKYALSWACWNWYVVWVYYPQNSERNYQHAIDKRNKEMVGAAHFLVAFWDGKCQSTSKLIEAARATDRVKIEVIQL